MNADRYSAFADFIRNMDPKESEMEHQKQSAKDKADFLDFKKKLLKNICKYCKKSINYIGGNKSCLHWLLKPPGLKTKQLVQTIHDYGWYSVASYLRWLATTEAFLKNINDFSDLDSETLFHETIKYRNMEWTLLCKKGDFEGHSGQINYPHFHVQLMVNGKVNISFNGEHYKLNDHDHWVLSMHRDHPDVFKFVPLMAPSLKTMTDLLPVEKIIQTLKNPLDGTSGNVQIQTMLMADDGETFSGEKLAAMIEEAKSKKVPVASLVTKHFPNAKIAQTLSPSDDTPENYERK